MCISYLENRACGMRLPLAGVAIGWLSALIAVLEAIAVSQILLNLNYVVRYVHPICNELLKQLQMETVSPRELHVWICLITLIILGTCFLDCICSALLIIGAKEGAEMMIFPWLLNSALWLLVKLFIIFSFWFKLVVDGNALDSKDITISFGFFVVFGISSYMWLAVYSLYLSIRRETFF